MEKIVISPLFLLSALLLFGCQTIGMSSGRGIEGTAIHEAGHGFIAHGYGAFVSAELLPDGRSGEFGRCFISMPDTSEESAYGEIEIRLAGIIAKWLFAGSNYGAYDDLKNAAEMAENLATRRKGCGGIGNGSAKKELKNLFFANFLAETWLPLSLDAKELLSGAYCRTKETLQKNEATVRAMSEILLSRKKLDKKDLEALAP